MLLSMSKVTPTYETLSTTVQNLSIALEKSQSNHRASLETIKSLNGELSRLTNRIQKLENFIRDQNALLQEHGLADYGNWLYSSICYSIYYSSGNYFKFIFRDYSIFYFMTENTTTESKVFQLTTELEEMKQRKKQFNRAYNEEIKRIQAEIKDLICPEEVVELP